MLPICSQVLTFLYAIFIVKALKAENLEVVGGLTETAPNLEIPSFNLTLRPVRLFQVESIFFASYFFFASVTRKVGRKRTQNTENRSSDLH